MFSLYVMKLPILQLQKLEEHLQLADYMPLKYKALNFNFGKVCQQ